MDKLCEGKQKLHEAARRYIIEKKNFEKEIKALKNDLSPHQQTIDDLEEWMR